MVIPCYNELGNLPSLVEEYERLRQEFPLDLILVDDGSTDGSGEFLSESAESRPWVHVLTHTANRGFAETLKDGLRLAMRKGYDLIGQMDADFTHPPELLKSLLLKAERSDMVIASRFLPGGGMRDVPRWRVWLSTAANGFFRAVLGSKVRDMTSGFRVSRARVLESIDLESDSFQIQLELTVRAERLGFRLTEVPFVLANRRVGRSNFKLSCLRWYPPLLARLLWLPRSPRGEPVTHERVGEPATKG